MTKKLAPEKRKRPKHTMPDGTVMPGRTHEEYVASLVAKEAAKLKKKGGKSGGKSGGKKC